MSFDNIPSKSEVMGWASHNLAEFLKSRRDLSGCDKVVLKCNINGPRFLNMSDNDLQKFPKLHAPLISRICLEINKKEEKKSFFPLSRPSANKVPETVEVPQEDQGWGSEEFESDDDYENPDSNDEGGGSVDEYEHAEDGDVASDNDYEPPPSEPSEELHRQICIAKPMNNSEYIDRSSVKSQPPVPPSRPGPGSGPPPPAPGRPSIGQFPRAEPQRPDRHGKPPPPDRSKKPGSNEKGSNAAAGPGGSMSNERSATPPRRNCGMEKFSEPPRMSKPPLPSGVRRSASSVTPSPSHQRNTLDPRNEFHDDHARSSFTFPHSNHSRNPSPRPHPHRDESQPDNFNKTMSLPSRQPESMNSYRGSSRNPPQPARPSEQNKDQDMDPAWYVGQVTRGQAEGNLRQVNRDGTFLVRDSSKGSPAQPYTLMVLYQGKVFNIQIQKVQNGYLLGTGLKACELFPSVSDIIKQHTQMPLLLIDAKSRGHNTDSGHHKQCALTHPAGF